MNPVVFSSERQDWATPWRFFAELDREYRFTLDACATAENAKCLDYWSPADDALKQPWRGVVWCNPPYGYQIHKWVKKAFEEAQKGNVVVMLIPARTDTTYWHDYVMKADEIRLVRGRLTFVGAQSGAPFPNAVVVFRPGTHVPRLTTMDRLLDEPRRIVPSTDTPPKRVRGRCVGVRIGVPLIVPEDGDLTDLPLFATLEAS